MAEKHEKNVLNKTVWLGTFSNISLNNVILKIYYQYQNNPFFDTLHLETF